MAGTCKGSQGNIYNSLKKDVDRKNDFPRFFLEGIQMSILLLFHRDSSSLFQTRLPLKGWEEMGDGFVSTNQAFYSSALPPFFVPL